MVEVFSNLHKWPRNGGGGLQAPVKTPPPTTLQLGLLGCCAKSVRPGVFAQCNSRFPKIENPGRDCSGENTKYLPHYPDLSPQVKHL